MVMGIDRMTTMSLLRMEMLPVLRRLPRYTRLVWGLLRDRRIRRRHKAVLLGGVGYLLSPIDVIPGFIPILGQVDDLGIVLWAIRRTLRASAPAVAQEHLTTHALTWEVLDDDLDRLRRSGRLITGAAFRLGWRAGGAAVRLGGRAGGLAAQTVRRLARQLRER